VFDLKKIFIAAMLVGCLFLLGCAQTQAPASGGTSASAAPSFAPAPTASVSILDGSTDPSTLEVKAGTVVVFKNNGKAVHDVVFENEESATLAPGESFSKLFNEPGDYYYSSSLDYGLENGVIKVS
jgi:plastocyanin